jgi:hypothetical protein
MSPDMVPGTELHSTGGKPGKIIVVFGRSRLTAISAITPPSF